MKTEIEIKVRGYHLDLFSHVNNARYLEFLEEARWSSFEDLNISPEYFTDSGRGLAVVNMNISYLRPATVGDLLRIVTEPESLGNKSVTLKQTIYLNSSDTVIVEAYVKFVVIDLTTGRAVELDDELKLFWQPVMVG